MGALPELDGVAGRRRPRRRARSAHACARRGRAARPARRAPGLPARRPGPGRGGRTASTDVVVFSCLDFPAEERTLHEQESVVDLAGPGAELTPYAAGTNVVLTFGPRDGLGNEELEAWARRTTLAVAEELASPDAERGAGGRRAVRARSRPTRASLRSPRSSSSPTSGRSTTSSSTACRSGSAGLPRVVDPAELLDGAVTSGEYHWAALRNPTIVFQRNALVRALYREHGRRLRFAGLVLMRGYEQTAEDKQRAAAAAAEAAGRPRRRRGRRDDRRRRELPHRRDAHRARVRAGRR